MNLKEAKKEAIEAMQKAVQEGKFTEEDGDRFIKTISGLKDKY